MKALVLAALLIAGCSKPREETEDASRGRAATNRPTVRAHAPRLATLVGLYEGGPAGRRDRMCIVGDKAGRNFGLVVWGAGESSCSGLGSVARAGDAVRLAMRGDAACAIVAKVEGKALLFPATVPAGCAYYCGAPATLVNARLVQIAAGTTAARKATDLVGESLCG